ncbi:MAG: indole-3-glycerol phosphate synthase TrpC [Thermodesulfobacteria bacterium]|nr:indole-3-glycerol phosphate synthase TrpC [Thermodesulfobacteriota bacterium]
MNILDKIVERKREEVDSLLKHGIEHPDRDPGPKRPFKKALIEASPIGLIAEAKKASPSKGLLCPDFDPVTLARQYQEGGADAMSVLTDEEFFQGRLEYLHAAKENSHLPILRKDFLIHHIQVEEADVWGADAILLICAILELSLLEELLHHARERGLDCLVEVHDEPEAEKALKAGADLIGINNRNLKDFSVDLATSIRVRAEIPESVPVVSESGIRDHDDIKRLLEGNIQAVLIGETLVKSENRQEKIRELKGL